MAFDRGHRTLRAHFSLGIVKFDTLLTIINSWYYYSLIYSITCGHMKLQCIIVEAYFLSNSLHSNNRKYTSHTTHSYQQHIHYYSIPPLCYAAIGGWLFNDNCLGVRTQWKLAFDEFDEMIYHWCHMIFEKLLMSG